MGRIRKGEDMREPEISPIQEVEHVVEECMEQDIPIHYDTEINIATFYLLDNLLKRVAALEKIAIARTE